MSTPPSPAVVVLGSLTMDYTTLCARMPQEGETVLGNEFFSCPGGKGNNQAISSARMGASTLMVGCVGTDSQAGEILSLSEALGAGHLSLDVTRVPGGSGVAQIVVDAHGRNRIVMVPQANLHLNANRVDSAAGALSHARVVVMQLETPLEAVSRAFSLAPQAVCILNPAPAQALPDDLYALVDVLVPNESEAAVLIGRPGEALSEAECLEAARALCTRGATTVIVTRGDAGVVLAGPAGEFSLPAPSVEALDSTAAGDAFCGGLAAGLAAGLNLLDAVRLAQGAGALACTRLGAAGSLPLLADVRALLG